MQEELLGLHSCLRTSINLLYSRLIDELDSQFKLHYTTHEDTAAEEGFLNFVLFTSNVLVGYCLQSITHTHYFD